MWGAMTGPPAPKRSINQKPRRKLTMRRSRKAPSGRRKCEMKCEYAQSVKLILSLTSYLKYKTNHIPQTECTRAGDALPGGGSSSFSIFLSALYTTLILIPGAPSSRPFRGPCPRRGRRHSCLCPWPPAPGGSPICPVPPPPCSAPLALCPCSLSWGRS